MPATRAACGSVCGWTWRRRIGRARSSAAFRRASRWSRCSKSAGGTGSSSRSPMRRSSKGAFGRSRPNRRPWWSVARNRFHWPSLSGPARSPSGFIAPHRSLFLRRRPRAWSSICSPGRRRWTTGRPCWARCSSVQARCDHRRLRALPGVCAAGSNHACRTGDRASRCLPVPRLAAPNRRLAGNPAAARARSSR
jgi:hypothetical protein